MNIAHRDSRNAGQSVITELFKREEMSMTRKKLLEKLSERRGSFRPQPHGTVVYEVQASDTLAGIAARCNITPSELVNLNRLSSRTIFSGQIIFIPDKTAPMDSPHVVDIKQVVPPIQEQESPKPGHVERVQSPVGQSHVNDIVADEKRTSPRTTPSTLAEELDKESVEQSLKINVKYITDGEGVVSGVLLVTPNLVMFDPNVSDPLVIEHGTEKYGVVAPMHMVVKAALYPDIMRMRVKDAPDSGITPKMPDLYHSKNLRFGRSRTEEKMETPSDHALIAARRHSSVCESRTVENSDLSFSKSKHMEHHKSSEAISDAASGKNSSNQIFGPSNSKSKQASKVNSSLADSECSGSAAEIQKTSPIKFAQSKGLTSSVPSLESGLEKHFATVAHSQSFTEKKTPRKKSSSEDEELPCDTVVKDTKKKKYDFEKAKQKLQRGLRKLSITDGLLPAVSNTLNHRRRSLPSSPHSLSELKIKSDASTSHEKKKTSAPGSGTKDTNETSYRNEVDEKPDLFLPFDKIIPRPAQSFDHSPLYLCLRMGKPIKKPLYRSTPVMHYGKKVKSEYWFSIPQARVDSLYLFFLRWTPHIYGDIDVKSFEELGFLPIDHTDDEDEELAETSYSAERRKSSWAFLWKKRKSKDVEFFKPDDHDLSPVDWELISPQFEDKSPTIETEIVPELHSPSSILKEDQIKSLCLHLPARAIGYAWSLIYSTALHGFSLKTMYREMANYDTPVLLVVCSTTGAVFGALLSCPLRISDHFFGTGESFLFTFHPEFKCYHWSGENAYFIKGNAASFAIGASEGNFGLWLDDDLFHGRTQECVTYGNDPLCEEEDFVVKALEAWGFV